MSFLWFKFRSTSSPRWPIAKVPSNLFLVLVGLSGFCELRGKRRSLSSKALLAINQTVHTNELLKFVRLFLDHARVRELLTIYSPKLQYVKKSLSIHPRLRVLLFLPVEHLDRGSFRHPDSQSSRLLSDLSDKLQHLSFYLIAIA